MRREILLQGIETSQKWIKVMIAQLRSKKRWLVHLKQSEFHEM